QGGIVPSYAIIVREYFSPREAGTRIGLVIMATLFGMALGGWMSGAIFDYTGSYRAAFANGLAWNLLDVTIAMWLLFRSGRRMAFAYRAAAHRGTPRGRRRLDRNSPAQIGHRGRRRSSPCSCPTRQAAGREDRQGSARMIRLHRTRNNSVTSKHG